MNSVSDMTFSNAAKGEGPEDYPPKKRIKRLKRGSSKLSLHDTTLEEARGGGNSARVECEPPLFRACDLNRLAHQLRQHLQLLAQSYVMTVSSGGSLKNIATSAKSMVIELKNFARYYGHTSNFAVCNLDATWTLVNLWPSKKECSLLGDSDHHQFPLHVVKIIAGSPAFLYNNLLPKRYNQRHASSASRFCHGEDLLLVSAMDELELSEQAAKVISEVLLVTRSPKTIMDRAAELKTGQWRAIRACLAKEVPTPTIGKEDMLPLRFRSRKGLGQQWITLLSRIMELPRGKWEERLSKDIGGERVTTTKPFVLSHSDRVIRVFPNGMCLAETKCGDQVPVISTENRVVGVLIPAVQKRAATRTSGLLHEYDESSEASSVNSNVIMEGTEVELTEDEEIDYIPGEPTELILLSSDDEPGADDEPRADDEPVADDEPGADDDGEAFLSRVQSRTDPEIYSKLMKILLDAGEEETVNEAELYRNVCSLLVNYTDLCDQFAKTFLLSMGNPQVDLIAGGQVDNGGGKNWQVIPWKQPQLPEPLSDNETAYSPPPVENRVIIEDVDEEEKEDVEIDWEAFIR